MAVEAPVRTPLMELERELARMANAQFESDAFRRLLSTSLNIARGKIYIVQRTHWQVNRRDCWAQVQANAPLDVKAVIWDHEREELGGDPATGKPDHYTMSVREGGALGLEVEDFTRIPPSDGCVTVSYAWLHFARTAHWLSGLAASAALELSNSDEVVKGGSMSRRMAIKLRDEAGIPMKKQISNVEHMAADVEHAHLLMEVAKKHAKTDHDRDLIVEGARRSWQIDRIWKGHLADLMNGIPL